MKRLVGIDYGRKRLGIAMTDGLGITAQGHPTVTTSGFEDAVKQVLAFVSEHEVVSIVVGLPLNMDGSRGEMAKEADRFGRALEERSGIEVVFWDERLTSEQAKRFLNQGGRSRSTRGEVDRVAAALMLESYLRANPIE